MQITWYLRTNITGAYRHGQEINKKLIMMLLFSFSIFPQKNIQHFNVFIHLLTAAIHTDSYNNQKNATNVPQGTPQILVKGSRNNSPRSQETHLYQHSVLHLDTFCFSALSTAGMSTTTTGPESSTC